MSWVIASQRPSPRFLLDGYVFFRDPAPQVSGQRWCHSRCSGSEQEPDYPHAPSLSRVSNDGDITLFIIGDSSWLRAPSGLLTPIIGEEMRSNYRLVVGLGEYDESLATTLASALSSRGFVDKPHVRRDTFRSNAETLLSYLGASRDAIHHDLAFLNVPFETVPLSRAA
jgi:hypothetical protein